MAGWACNEAPGVLEETKRVARLLDIIARISSRPKIWTRRALATAFDVSERRIQQDLEILIHRLHLPLAHCRTGYYLTAPQALGSVHFAFGEAVALLLAANVAGSMAGVGSAELGAALTRLKESFPVEFRSILDPLLSRRADGDDDGARRHNLELLQEAIATRRAVRMRYATASRDNAESERAVDPYALVPYVRSFHLVGLCHTRGEVRTFKVDRIRELRLTGEAFAIPPDFDLRAYLGDSWGMIRGQEAPAEEVAIRFSARAGRWVSEERWHASQKAAWQPDGSLLFSLRIALTPDFVRWVLYYGSEAEVLRPAGLREAVRNEAEMVVKGYDFGAPTSGQKTAAATDAAQ